MTERLNMDSYCRVCMVQNPDELISLFQIHESEDDVIANMIIDCTEVMVSDDDNLPQNICKDCLIRLNHAYKLRKQCQRSDQAFRTMLLQVEQQPPKNETEACKTSEQLFLTSLNEGHFQTIKAEKDYRLVKITGLRCCGCNGIFGNSDELKIHSLMSHARSAKSDRSTHECSVCGAGFSSRKELTNHQMDLQHLYYACNQCELMLRTEDELVQHLKDVHGEADELSEPSEKKVVLFENSKGDPELEEELMDEEQEIEYLDEDADFVDLNMEIKTESPNEDRSGTTKQLLRILPKPEFISKTEELPLYTIYHIRGERCCGCLRLFADIPSLLIHSDQEHGKRQNIKVAKHQCDVCFQRLGSKLLFSKHKQSANEKTMYLCKLCDSVLADERSFAKHIISTDKHEAVIDAVKIEGKYEEISDEGIRCCTCDIKCDEEEEMQKHIEELHPPSSEVEDDGDFKCNRCFKGFHRKSDLARHESNAQQKLSYRCCTEGCNYTTSNKRQILKHVTTKYIHQNLTTRKTTTNRSKDDPSGEDSRYSCCFARCCESFASYQELENHVESIHETLRIQHRQDRVFTQAVCPICLKGFESEQAYEKHRSTDRNRKHVCLKCGVQYVSKSTLLQHERSKCGKVAQYQCPQCDKTFVSLGGLHNHQEVHSQKRPYICGTCGRGFLRKGVLKDHINTVHSKLRLFQCSLCPKSFTSRNVFQSHQATHTKEKPYQCRHCEKRYYKTSDRTMHENQVHLGIRPFQCNFCPASFIRDRERRLHERTHTKAKLYSCDLCPEGYNKFGEYKSHRLAEHGLETLRDLGPATMAAVHGEQMETMPEKQHCKLEIEVFDMVE